MIVVYIHIPFCRTSCVHQLFEEHAERAHDACAVEYGEGRISYGELNRRANQISHLIRQQGVRPGTLVGLCMKSTPDMIAATLAILKAGGAYVPLDPAYPAPRLHFMIEDAGIRLIVTQQDLLEYIPEKGVQTLCVDSQGSGIAESSGENVPVPLTSDAVANVIYTSGSTGKPKGVCVPHKAIVRLLRNTNYIELGPDDAIAQASNISFDAATFELWAALLNGGRLVIVPRDMALSPPVYAQFLKERSITALFITTALFNEMARQMPDALSTVKHVMFGGESANPLCVRAVLESKPPQRLINVYGPTETTTYATWYLVENVPPDAVDIPIGRPIANTTLYILDRYLEPVPVGVPGELYIGGNGLATGYLNRPDLTAERFVHNPFSDSPDDRLYKTGDRVRYLSDGNVQFLGRFDNQVKMRGFRIELGEIEAALRQHPGVETCTVLVREDTPGNKRIVAYIVPTGPAEPDPELAAILRRFLAEMLPDYMVPSVFVPVESIPLTPNGKIDWRALPVPASGRTRSGTEPERPSQPYEKDVAEVWRELLRLDDVGVDENFFEVGGHSLLAVRLLAMLNERFNIQLPLRTFLVKPTIAGVAQQIAAARNETPAPLAGPQPGSLPTAIVPIQPKGNTRPFFCIAPGGGVVFPYYNLLPYLDPTRPFYGLQDPGLDDGNEPYATIEELARYYVGVMREVQPEGPYMIGGWSFGGFVALDMAQQLHQAGFEVSLLAIIDMPRHIYDATSFAKLKKTGGNLLGAMKYLGWGLRNIGPYLRDAVYVMTARGKLRRHDGVGKPTVAEYIGWLWLDVMRRISIGQSDIEKALPQDSVLLSIRQPAVRPILRVNDANVKAMRSYQVMPYPGRITLIRAEERTFNSPIENDATLGWHDYAAGGVDVLSVPGNHVTIFRKPCIEFLGKRLRDAIDRADASPEPDNRSPHV